MRNNNVLAIVAAVKEELQMLKNRLALERELRLGPIVVYNGTAFGHDIYLCEGGVGAVSMATTVCSLISKYSPDNFLLIGTGGGFAQSGIKPLQVAVASREIAPQLGVESKPRSPLTAPLPFAKREIALDPALAAKATSVIASDNTFQRAFLGSFLTVFTVSSYPSTAATYYREYKPMIENMEGFGAAYPCSIHGIPLVELRVVSNEVGDRNKKNWQLKKACHIAQQAALLLLESGVFH